MRIYWLLSVCVCWTSLAVGQQGPTRTELTADGRLLVNGEPTFFIGTAPGPRVDLKTPEGGDGWAELADGGINVVRGPQLDSASSKSLAISKEYMDATIARGVHVWPFLWHIVEKDTVKSRAILTEIIETFKDHPAVFFWKFSDEPEWGKVPVPPLVSSYKLVRKLDPNHLIWITHAPRGTTETLRPYSAACDVLALDIYPVSEPPGKHSLEPNRGLSMVGDYTQRMVHLAEGKKMVFMILQVFWSGVNPEHNPQNRKMFPTAHQERYMTYQAIINGANSLSYFGLDGGGDGVDKELGLNWTYWRAVLKPLLSEIKKGSEIYPALVAPDSKYRLKFTGAPQIEARWKEVGDELFIFAAAREGATQTVKFSGVADGPVKVVYENRTLEAKGGEFTDTFNQHDVHVYRVKRAGQK